MQEFLLKYSKSAMKWEDALPLGNGRIGAMVFSRGKEEILRLNEETLWEGFPYDFDNPETREYLPIIRKLIFEKKYSQAQEIALKKHICKDGGSARCNPGEPFGTFRGAGDLLLEDMNEVNVLKRELDLKHGIVYTLTDRYVRTHFTSLTENVFVINIRSKKDKLNIAFRFDHNGGDFLDDKKNIAYKNENDRKFYGTEIIKDFSKKFEGVEVADSISYSEQLLGDGAMKWAFFCDFVTDGKREKLFDGIKITDATEITAFVSIATSYNNEDPVKTVSDTVKKAIYTGYEALLDEHKKAFSELMLRSELQLEGDEKLQELDTDVRLNLIKEGGTDNGFAELYFNYGKYLLISSSKKGCKLPANLQGLWTKDNQPPWSSDYHININLQMNYWPSEVTGLSDCNDSFFEYIRFLSVHGRKTAEIMYGCSGWVSHHATTPHGFTSAGNNPKWGSFVCAGAWCVTHIYNHYRYTLDKEFLKGYWDVITESVRFFLDYLVESPEGYLVTCPSNSPENSFIDPETGERVGLYPGPTMDTQIIRDLFSGYVELSETVEEYELVEKVKASLEKLVPTRIGKHGNIMEWLEDFDEAEPGHRHISHLYGLYPSEQINKNTPELFEGAKKTIERRLKYGGGHTGWSRAWIINFYARLFDGEEAYFHLLEFYKKSTFSNLFDSHPPFQIDGNFGVTAGIINMLLSDVGDEITLLPALPKEWKNGSFKGFRAKGKKIVSCSWRDGKIIESKIENI